MFNYDADYNLIKLLIIFLGNFFHSSSKDLPLNHFVSRYGNIDKNERNELFFYSIKVTITI